MSQSVLEREDSASSPSAPDTTPAAVTSPPTTESSPAAESHDSPTSSIQKRRTEAALAKHQTHEGHKSRKVLEKASTQNLFVGRLPRNFNNEDLMKAFAAYQPISATVMMDMVSGSSKGFGFVTFDTPEDGERAMKAMNAIIVPGCPHPFDIQPSNYNGRRIVVESRYVYFRNFPVAYATSPLEFLRQFFSTHCGITGVEEVRAHSNNPTDDPAAADSGSGRGGGGGGRGSRRNSSQQQQQQQSIGLAPAFLVTFSTQPEAEKAISMCHGKQLFPAVTSLPIMAKYADMTTVKKLDKEPKSGLSADAKVFTPPMTVTAGIPDRSPGTQSLQPPVAAGVPSVPAYQMAMTPAYGVQPPPSAPAQAQPYIAYVPTLIQAAGPAGVPTAASTTSAAATAGGVAPVMMAPAPAMYAAPTQYQAMATSAVPPSITTPPQQPMMFYAVPTTTAPLQ